MDFYAFVFIILLLKVLCTYGLFSTIDCIHDKDSRHTLFFIDPKIRYCVPLLELLARAVTHRACLRAAYQ
jgi:hypothetical protein